MDSNSSRKMMDGADCLAFLKILEWHARIPHPLGDEFRAFDADEIRLSFVGDGLGQQGLSGTWRPEQNDASGA